MTEPSQYFKGRTVQEQMNEVIGYVDTRAAEVATTAIASDVAQVHQDMLDADADAQAAAASAAAAAGTLANAVKKTGEVSQSIAGDIAVAGDLTGGTVTVPAPVNNTDAANKKYVDDADALKANKTYVDAQDALKADKTYVDAQDALKVSITDINSYAVGLTGNQSPITGTKTFIGSIEGGNINSSGGNITLWGDQPFSKIQIKHRVDDITVAPASAVNYPNVTWRDKNGVVLCVLTVAHQTDNTVSLLLQLRNTDGTNKNIVLGRSDVVP